MFRKNTQKTCKSLLTQLDQQFQGRNLSLNNLRGIVEKLTSLALISNLLNCFRIIATKIKLDLVEDLPQILILFLGCMIFVTLFDINANFM